MCVSSQVFSKNQKKTGAGTREPRERQQQSFQRRAAAQVDQDDGSVDEGADRAPGPGERRRREDVSKLVFQQCPRQQKQGPARARHLELQARLHPQRRKSNFFLQALSHYCFCYNA